LNSLKLVKVYVDLPSGRQAVSIPPLHSYFHSLTEEAYWLLLEGPKLEHLSLFAADSGACQAGRQPADAMAATDQQKLRRVLSQLTIPNRANAPLWVLLSRVELADSLPPRLPSQMPDGDFLKEVSQKFLHRVEQSRLDELRELVDKRYQTMLSILGQDRYSTSLSFVKERFFETLAGHLSYSVAEELESRLKADAPAKPAPPPVTKPAPPPVSASLELDPIAVSIGRGLLGLAMPQQGQPLLEKVTRVRSQLAQQIGIVLPGVRVRDDLTLKACQYKILLRGQEVAGGEIRPDRSLMMGKLEKLKGLDAAQEPNAWVKDPLFSLPAVWSSRGTASTEPSGLLEVDAVSVFANHLNEVLLRSAAEIFCYQSYAVHMERHSKQFPHLHQALEKKQVDPVQTWRLLRELLCERVSIRDLSTILETILIQPSLPLEELVEKCRVSLSRQITRFHLESSTQIEVVMLRPEQERALQDSTVSGLEELYHELTQTYQAATDGGWGVNFLVAPEYRRPLRDLLKLALPRAYFLSTSELTPNTRVIPLDLYAGQDEFQAD